MNGILPRIGRLDYVVCLSIFSLSLRFQNLLLNEQKSGQAIRNHKRSKLFPLPKKKPCLQAFSVVVSFMAQAMGVVIYFDRIFHYKPSILWGYLIYGTPIHV